MTPARIRLGFVVSHPIQYHAPLFRRLDRSDIIDLEVLFLSRHGVVESYDAGFDAKIAYDVPLLDGFRIASPRTGPRFRHPALRWGSSTRASPT